MQEENWGKDRDIDSTSFVSSGVEDADRRDRYQSITTSSRGAGATSGVVKRQRITTDEMTRLASGDYADWARGQSFLGVTADNHQALLLAQPSKPLTD